MLPSNAETAPQQQKSQTDNDTSRAPRASGEITATVPSSSHGVSTARANTSSQYRRIAPKATPQSVPTSYLTTFPIGSFQASVQQDENGPCPMTVAGVTARKRKADDDDIEQPDAQIKANDGRPVRSKVASSPVQSENGDFSSPNVLDEPTTTSTVESTTAIDRSWEKLFKLLRDVEANERRLHLRFMSLQNERAIIRKRQVELAKAMLQLDKEEHKLNEERREVQDAWREFNEREKNTQRLANLGREQ